MTNEYFDDEENDNIWLSSGEDSENYKVQITQSKKNNGIVFIVSAYGSKKFKQKIIKVLKKLDSDKENNIEVNDIHGQDVFEPEYNTENTNDPDKEYLN